ncbi:hypothetical protein Vlu01_40410 [Micromonospora lutea]|uniref:PASTA domain-containing protein n=1 Tax=Micromonospora lutea TaxID=419825 RepID=A0ABQ4IZY2_9ACTN|nr:hypothetical protein Vlu01_40410 [Micromonospora lutea]
MADREPLSRINTEDRSSSEPVTVPRIQPGDEKAAADLREVGVEQDETMSFGKAASEGKTTAYLITARPGVPVGSKQARVRPRRSVTTHG